MVTLTGTVTVKMVVLAEVAEMILQPLVETQLQVKAFVEETQVHKTLTVVAEAEAPVALAEIKIEQLTAVEMVALV